MGMLERLIERLGYKKIKSSEKIKFSGWQMPLDEWRRGGHDMEVPEGTEYIGSFDINYGGKVSGKIFDVYITKRFGYLEAVMSGDWRQEQQKQLKIRRRGNVIHDGNKRENAIHDGNM